jgi:hypothetical protein
MLAVAGWLTGGAFGPVCFPKHGTGKRNWMLRSGGMADRRAFGPVCFSKQFQAEREPA